MVRVQPFAAVRPLPSLAARVASVPYDVVNTDEARQLAADNPYSFLRVVRSEIDLPPETDPHDPVVYATAADRFRQLLADGTLIREPEPSLYLYRLAMAGRTQLGLVGCCHVDDYTGNVIKKHENTRPEKEDDRTRHMLALGAHTGTVLLTYRDHPGFNELARHDVNTRPLTHFDAPDGVTHTVWTVEQPKAYCDLFASIECAYMADGHHRAASAVRAAGVHARQDSAALRAAGSQRKAGGDAERDWFLAALFPASALTILAYNRVVTDLGGKTPDQVLDELGGAGSLTRTDRPQPQRPGVVCIYLDGQWRELAFDPATIDRDDPIGSLDAALLQERVLTPLLGIGDPRSDRRLDFVGGIRGTEALERRVDAGEAAVAFSMFPTSIDQLLSVADAGLIMAPKSTWFEPKLRSGLFVHTFG
ncbi:MAG: DUF1015 domain-containing protein [Planctomycetota bacterium]|jgi:uncharacterized protein (DUF1015 family)